MELKTFDTILTEFCDIFDTLIAPKKMNRSNSNVIYLLFKAIAKGGEVINNVCVSLNNKFDPSLCSDADLESVAKLVGTKRIEGNGSGLRITCYNSNAYSETLLRGEYWYSLDANTKFYFTLLEDTTIASLDSVSFLAVTDVKGNFPVTEQSSIAVESDVSIPTGMKWSCQNNASLLGGKDESDNAFRKRIISDSSRQNSIYELQLAIKNIPYILDCQIKYNDSFEDVTYDGITIPPFSMAIFCNGNIRNELAELVASYTVVPTVNDSTAKATYYQNEVFITGEYVVYFIPFRKVNYSVTVHYLFNPLYITESTAEAQIKEALLIQLNTDQHQDYLKESDVYAVLDSLNITGVNILGANLIYEGNQVDYIEIPKSRVASLLTENIICDGEQANV